MLSKRKTAIAIGATCLLLSSNSSYAATVKKYEVKVFADSGKVINKDRHIKNSILDLLGSSDKDEDFKVMFLDNNDEILNSQNFSVRIRKSENDKNTELQYKKRYEIINEDIQGAIKRAVDEGFSDADFEVEYGVNKKTLSVTKETSFISNISGDTSLPKLKATYEYAKKFLPLEFSNSFSYIKVPKAIGPVKFERHEGLIDDYKIKIENWEINDKNIVEISTKVTSLDEAKSVQDSIIEKLKALEIYEPTEQLKTKMIFESY